MLATSKEYARQIELTEQKVQLEEKRARVEAQWANSETQRANLAEAKIIELQGELERLRRRKNEPKFKTQGFWLDFLILVQPVSHS